MKMQHDLYPSRVQPAPEIRKRLDPVVYGTAGADAPLTAEQIDFYETNGYLFFESFLDPQELAALQAEMNRLRNDEALCSGETAITERDSGALRSLFEIHRSSSVFGGLAASERLARMAEFLLDDQVYIHQSRLNYKPGFQGKEFYWHSDFETWHVEDGMPNMRALSMSISLSENTEHNGPLMVMPGSHRQFISCVGETPEDHYKQSLKKQDYGVPDDVSLGLLAENGGIVAPKGPPGSLVLFDCNIMHGSNSNITPYPRSNLFMVYNSVSNRLLNPFSGQKPRPEFIAARKSMEPLGASHMAAE